MQAQVEEFDHEWNEGDRDVATEIAKGYFAGHPELLPYLQAQSLEALVHMVDAYRAAGDEENRIVLDMYLRAYFEPQKIGGTIQMGGQRRSDG